MTIIINVPNTLQRIDADEAVPKQGLGLLGCTGWFAIALPAVVRAEICNLLMVSVIARRLFAKGTVESIMSTN